MLNHNRLYGAARMVAHCHPMSFKKAMISSSEIHRLNKLEITLAPSLIPMVAWIALQCSSIIVQVRLSCCTGCALHNSLDCSGQQQAGGLAFSPPSPLNLQEGASQLIQPQGAYYRVQWRRDRDQPLPSGFYQNGNALQISNARPDQSGTYFCELYGADGTPVTVPYEIRVRPGDRPPLPSGKLIYTYPCIPRNSLSPRWSTKN